MNAKMIALADALTAKGLPARVQGDVIFCEGWGIYCSLIGKVQARLVYDQQERFTIGAIIEPVDDLVEFFQFGLSSLYGM